MEREMHVLPRTTTVKIWKLDQNKSANLWLKASSFSWILMQNKRNLIICQKKQWAQCFSAPAFSFLFFMDQTSQQKKWIDQLSSNIYFQYLFFPASSSIINSWPLIHFFPAPHILLLAELTRVLQVVSFLRGLHIILGQLAYSQFISRRKKNVFSWKLSRNLIKWPKCPKFHMKL